jgi:hypothetical protein
MHAIKSVFRSYPNVLSCNHSYCNCTEIFVHFPSSSLVLSPYGYCYTVIDFPSHSFVRWVFPSKPKSSALFLPTPSPLPKMQRFHLFVFVFFFFCRPLLLLPRSRHVLLHTRQVVVDGIRRRRRSRGAIHAFPELVLYCCATRCVVTCRSPAC